MSVPRPWRRPARIGIALGADRLVAARLDPRARPTRTPDVWRTGLAALAEPAAPGTPDERVDAATSVAPAAPDDLRSVLASALRALEDALGVRAGILHVALLPPLVEVRHLTLPRLRPAELRHVLGRDASRYFLDAADPPVIGAETLPGAGRGPAPVLAAAAPSRWLDALHAAAAEVGWAIDAVVPAHAAWIAAAGALRGGRRGGGRRAAGADGTTIVVGEDRVDVLRAEHGWLTGLRRLPGDDRAPGRVPAIVAGDGDRGPVILLGPEERCADARAALVAAGVSVRDPVPSGDDVAADPDALAARFAVRAVGPELLPDPVRAARRRAARRSTMALAGAAAVLVLAAAGVELWGLHRDLAAVERRRAELATRVDAALQTRDRITGLEDRVTALAALEATSPRWTAVLATVAERLPRDAHLVAFRAAGDTVVLEGAAGHAAGVFEALRAAPGVVAVRARGPVRREVRDDGPPVERFAIAIELAPAAGGEGATP